MIPHSTDIRDVLAKVLEHGAPDALLAAWLFGSYAESRQQRDSDVDVGVLFDRSCLPNARDRFEEGLGLTAALLQVTAPHQPDVVVVNDAPPGLAVRIVTTGHLLMCRDPEAEHAFRRDVQLRAADLEPFLRRSRRIKLDAIMR